MARPKGTKIWTPTKKELRQIYLLAGYGLNINMIADAMGVSKATFDRRRHDIPEINEALKKGRADALSEVAQTAYKLAKSGKCPAMTMFILKTQGGWSERYGPRDDEDDPIVIDIEAHERKAISG